MRRLNPSHGIPLRRRPSRRRPNTATRPGQRPNVTGHRGYGRVPGTPQSTPSDMRGRKPPPPAAALPAHACMGTSFCDRTSALRHAHQAKLAGPASAPARHVRPCIALVATSELRKRPRPDMSGPSRGRWRTPQVPSPYNNHISQQTAPSSRPWQVPRPWKVPAISDMKDHKHPVREGTARDVPLALNRASRSPLLYTYNIILLEP